MSDQEKPAMSFEEQDGNIEKEVQVDTQQSSSCSEKNSDIHQQVRCRKEEKIKRKKRDLKIKTEKKKKRRSQDQN